MANPAAILSILVKADGVARASGQIRDLDKDLDKANKTGGKTSSAFKKVGAVVGGVVAFETLRRGVGAAVAEFEEARKVGALTQSVIKSTGGAAKITAGEVGRLAERISNKTAIDDEAVQSGANLLLTFKNIRNEAGAGRDIFNQATAAAIDLSAAGFGSIKSASKQLGKALNDPVKGMTALGRSGVTFSEDQKKAIEALLATGKAADRVKAQQIILREVQSQVGGAAAAQATPLDKLRVVMANLAEAAGAVLVPAFDKAARFLAEFFGQMIENRGVGGALVSTFRQFGGALGTVVAAIVNAVKWFREHETVTLALAVAVGILTAAFVALKVKALLAMVPAIYSNVVAWLALKAAMLTNPIVLVGVALAALAAALVVAYKESETFRAIVDAAFKAVKVAGEAAFGWLRKAVPDVISFVRGRWENLKTIVQLYWNAYKTLIINPVRAAFEWVRGAVGTVIGFLRERWETIKTVTAAAWALVKNYIVDPVRDAFTAVKGALGSDGLLGWLKGKYEDFKDAANKVGGFFTTAFDKVGASVKKVIGFFDDVIDRVKSVIDFFKQIKIPKISIPGFGGGLPIGGGFSNVQQIADASLAFGLSGGRGPGQGYRPGDDGWHGQNRARDLSGPPGAMLAFASMLFNTMGPKLLELIYTPLGKGIKNGQPVGLSFPFPWDDHYDHVHVAMAKGGYLRQGGWAVVGERGPELAHLPSRTSVYSNSDSRAMLGGGMSERLLSRIAEALEAGGSVPDRQVERAVYKVISREFAREDQGRRAMPSHALGGVRY
jgi:hypothetical protein